jgi:biotin carboxylase
VTRPAAEGVVLCLASDFKGARFMLRARSLGADVHLLTESSLLDCAWPRDALAGVYAQPAPYTLEDRLRFVSYLARDRRFTRVVALDEFDLETAGALREHLRIPGPSMSEARAFRDKLVMRDRCAAAGIAIPDYTALVNDGEIREFTRRVPGPWMCKPRSLTSSIGISKVPDEAALWRLLDEQADDRSYHLLERYIAGDVYHVDSIVEAGVPVVSEAHRCGSPPFDVMHGGGIFTSTTVPRSSAAEAELLAATAAVVAALGLRDGAAHTEFIRSTADGRFYLLECGARVGGAHIAELVEAATGLNPWEAWADAVLHPTPPLRPSRRDHAGLIVTLARQEHPDLSTYTDPEIRYRVDRPFHAGLVVGAGEAARVGELIAAYERRFRQDFWTRLPAALV